LGEVFSPLGFNSKSWSGVSLTGNGQVHQAVCSQFEARAWRPGSSLPLTGTWTPKAGVEESLGGLLFILVELAEDLENLVGSCPLQAERHPPNPRSGGWDRRSRSWVSVCGRGALADSEYRAVPRPLRVGRTESREPPLIDSLSPYPRLPDELRQSWGG
jgi:hypothetical protein